MTVILLTGESEFIYPTPHFGTLYESQCLSLVDSDVQKKCYVKHDLDGRIRAGIVLSFICDFTPLHPLTWCYLTFRGIELAQKTQVMSSGFWWRNAFSAVRPERSATQSGWTIWCSYLWPWRQQPTKVMVPNAKRASYVSLWRDLPGDKEPRQWDGLCLGCTSLLMVFQVPMWLVCGGC